MSREQLDGGIHILSTGGATFHEENAITLYKLKIDMFSVEHGWPNFSTRGPNMRLPGHWRAGYNVVFVTDRSQCSCTAVHGLKLGA